MSEYRNKFTQLSRYCPADVAEDEQKQDHFRLGLTAPIKYQLLVHTFDSFQKLVDNIISVENARKEMGVEMKRKYESQGQSRNQHPCFGSPQGAPFQNQYQRPAQQNQQTP